MLRGNGYRGIKAYRPTATYMWTKTNSHRPTRLNSTVELSHVGAMYTLHTAQHAGD